MRPAGPPPPIVRPPRPIIDGEPIVFSIPELPDEEAHKIFSRFIEAVRERVKEEEGLAFGIPIMKEPAAVDSPKRYMKVRLEAHENQFTFYLDRSNLYVIGVSVYGWVFYFNDLRRDMRAYLEGDKALNHYTLTFDGGYLHDMLGFRIGIKALDFALYNLGKNQHATWKPSLLVAVQMISECARFRYLQECIIEKEKAKPSNPDAYELSERDVSRQHSWGFNCAKIVRFCRVNPEQVAPPEELMQQLEDIDNVYVLGLLKPPPPE